MAKVSIYKSLKDVKGQHIISVAGALGRIKNGARKFEIEEIRNCTDKKIYTERKNELSGVTFSGTFSQRQDTKMKTHSGFICIDFDYVDEPAGFRDSLKDNNFVYAAWLSPSAKGVKALIKITPSFSNHRKHFYALRNEFPSLDTQCINESRLAFESYDPDLWINENSLLFDKMDDGGGESSSYKKVLHISKTQEPSGTFENLIVWLTQNKRIEFTEGNRNRFIFLLAGASCRYGLPKETCILFCTQRFAVSRDFDYAEFSASINSAYKINANFFGTQSFDTEKSFDRNFNIKKELERINLEENPELVENGESDFYFDYADVIFGDLEGIEDIYKNGYGSAETTHFPQLDDYFKWKRGDFTLCSGIGNFGKTSFIIQLMLCKSVFDGVKWACFVPENMPSKLFYSELIEMLVGTSIVPSNFGRPPFELVENAHRFVAEHFIVVNPSDIAPTPSYIKSRFLGLIMKEGVSGILIDPFNQLLNDYSTTGGRDDKYLETFLSDLSFFVKRNNLLSVIIAHPTKMFKSVDEKDYQCPDVHKISGGAMWNNKMDNILFYHRPFFSSEPMNPLCEITTAKIRWQKIVGKRGTLQMNYSPEKRRFYTTDGDYCPLDTNKYNHNITKYVQREYIQLLEGGDIANNKKGGGQTTDANPYNVHETIHEGIVDECFYVLGDKPAVSSFKSILKQVIMEKRIAGAPVYNYFNYYLKNKIILATEDNKYIVRAHKNINKIKNSEKLRINEEDEDSCPF